MTQCSCKRRPTLTDAQVLQTCAVTRLAQIWRALDYVQKSTWFSFYSHPSVQGESAYLTFVSVNSARDAASLPNLLSAPETPTLPPPLPGEVTLESVIDTDGDARLWLSSPRFSHTVLVYGAAPMPSAQPVSKKRSAFKLLGALPALGGPCDLSALYAAKFRGVGIGAKLAIKLVALSDCGLRGQERVICAVTTLAPLIALPEPLIKQELTIAPVRVARRVGSVRRTRLPRLGETPGRVVSHSHSP